MLIKKVWLCLSVVITCQLGCAKQNPVAVKIYGSNDVYEVVLKAAEEGNASAQAELGSRFFVAKPPDYEKAVNWFRKAAEKGYARAQNSLGVCYDYGLSLSEDKVEAFKWYRKAAEQGNPAGLCNVGKCYEVGEGVSKDEAEAVKWYRKAAELGDPGGQTFLGLCYATGKGINRDPAEAIKLYRKAAEKGFADAQDQLGFCYEIGRGVNKDDEEAVKWYKKSAEQGSLLGQKRCSQYGVEWDSGLLDENSLVDEAMLEKLKAKAEAAKRRTLVFKSLYLGMPIKESAALLRLYISKGSTTNLPIIRVEKSPEKMWFREEKSGIRVDADLEGKVTAIYLPKAVVDKLFDVKGIEIKSFIAMFQKKYCGVDFIYDSAQLEVFSLNAIVGKMEGVQLIGMKSGTQGRWVATARDGYTVTVYDDVSDYVMRDLRDHAWNDFVETVKGGALLVRKINKSAFD